MLRSAPGEKQTLFIGDSSSTVVRRRFKTVLRRLSLLGPFSPISSSSVKSPDINQRRETKQGDGNTKGIIVLQDK